MLRFAASLLVLSFSSRAYLLQGEAPILEEGPPILEAPILEEETPILEAAVPLSARMPCFLLVGDPSWSSGADAFAVFADPESAGLADGNGFGGRLWECTDASDLERQWLASFDDVERANKVEQGQIVELIKHAGIGFYQYTGADFGGPGSSWLPMVDSFSWLLMVDASYELEEGRAVDDSVRRALRLIVSPEVLGTLRARDMAGFLKHNSWPAILEAEASLAAVVDEPIRGAFLFVKGGSFAVFADPERAGVINEHMFGGRLWECADASDLEQQWLASFNEVERADKVEKGKIVKVVEHRGITFYQYTGSDFGTPKHQVDAFSWLPMVDASYLTEEESQWTVDDSVRRALRLSPEVLGALRARDMGGFVEFLSWPAISEAAAGMDALPAKIPSFLFVEGGSFAVFVDPERAGVINEHEFGGLLWECADASDLEQLWLASFDESERANKVEKGKIVKVVEHAGIAFYQYTGSDFGGPKHSDSEFGFSDAFSWLPMVDASYLAEAGSQWAADDSVRRALRLIVAPEVLGALRARGMDGFLEFLSWPAILEAEAPLPAEIPSSLENLFDEPIGGAFLFVEGGSFAVFADPERAGVINAHRFGGRLWECADASDLEQQWLASFNEVERADKVEKGKIVKVVEHRGITFYQYTGSDFGTPKHQVDAFSWLPMVDASYLAQAGSPWAADDSVRWALRFTVSPEVLGALMARDMGGFAEFLSWPSVTETFWGEDGE